MKTWAIKNSSNIIINVKDDEHAHISAMCLITSDFQKLPIFFIAKESSESAEESQIGDLEFIREQYPIEKKDSFDC